ENEGRFPLALKDLAPDYLPNAALVTSTEERKVEYVAGLVMPKSPVDTRPKEPDHEPAETYPDRLMQFEQALELSGYGKFLKSEVIVRLSYPALALEGTLTTKGDVRVLNTGEDDSQQLAALRASDQNNLKQLGLVIKMFENEHNGYSPPGWLTTYPEYLTDPNVLVNPKDPPSAGWYDYLLPATHLEELAKQYVTDEGDPAAMARAMSELPLAMDTTDWPDGGRNLLFCDGHVEYTREWRGVLQRVQ
ncbi:MAG: hypothetical protein HYV26_01165, partial [Candidatus Hydrogenedentes bacterium]|nr:hypothetical protein [Candidatus Hydrogenedentota bacterium]